MRRARPIRSIRLALSNSSPRCNLRRYGSSLLPHKEARAATTKTSGIPNLARQSSFAPTSLPTIYALSTAPGPAAIAVIRISGPACVDIYHHLCPTKPLPKPRHATLRTLYSPHAPPSRSTILDSALVLYFPAPHTSTGDDVLELHIHGGPAVTTAVLAAIPRCHRAPPSSFPAQLSKFPSIRYAEPGEFTRRAFDNGRLDLTQIEALGDVLAARTEAQRRLSMRGTSNLARRYEGWRAALLHARGELEALIDFAEEQQFDKAPALLVASVAWQVGALKKQIDGSRANALRGELLRGGIEVALVGAPNGGKSSLLNRVVGREAAIVSRHAGTTRDVVEVGVDIGGFFVRVGDTAGLRKGTGDVVGEVEEEGIKRAKARALQADLVVVVLSVEDEPHGAMALRLDPEVLETAARCIHQGKDVVAVINKIDKIHHTLQVPTMASKEQWTHAVQAALPRLPLNRIFPISCLEAASDSVAPDPGNIQSFLNGLIAVLHDMTRTAVPDDAPGEVPDTLAWEESLGATERQRLLLEECAGHLDAFLGQAAAAATSNWDDIREEGTQAEIDVVVAAESLRGAADSLAKITGRGEAGDVEEVLGVIFEKFCVGK